MLTIRNLREDNVSISRVSRSQRARRHLFFEINNISIGLPSPVHAVLVTFPNNFKPTFIMSMTAGAELAIFSFLAVMMNYSKNLRIPHYEKNIQLASSCSNTFVFTYGMGCEIVALIAGNEVKLNHAMIAALSSVLFSAVSMSGINLYRDIKENNTDVGLLSPMWKKSSKALDGFLFMIAAFNAVVQAIKLTNSIQEADEKYAAILPMFKMILLISTFLIPIIVSCFNRDISKKVTQYIGATSNVIHDVGMEIGATQLSQPASTLTFSALAFKQVLTLGIYAHKKYVAPSEAAESLLENESNASSPRLTYTPTSEDQIDA